MLRHVLIKCLFVSAGILVWGLGVRAEVVIETVTVDNPGNPGDTRYPDDDVPSFGGVGYVYNIGKFEVTAGQYTEFLNAVAAKDTYDLYSGGGTYGCKIRQAGSPGSYAYVVDANGDDVEDADWVDRPVNYVSWCDAARFANWLHNGQPTGDQDLSTTEDGSYYLNGATTDGELMAVVREDDATWVIPSEDEWYKAAYHYNDGVTGDYYDYPTQSDTLPTWETPPGTDMTNGSANFYDLYEDDFAIGSPYYRTEVGAYDAKPSDSPYGTFDQGGNVWEWTEAILSAQRGHRGGSFYYSGISLHASFRNYGPPTFQHSLIGFRVAEVTEPDCTRDGDADLPHWSGFPDCMDGPGGGAHTTVCDVFDFDGDGDIDLDDAGQFHVLLSAFDIMGDWDSQPPYEEPFQPHTLEVSKQTMFIDWDDPAFGDVRTEIRQFDNACNRAVLLITEQPSDTSQEGLFTKVVWRFADADALSLDVYGLHASEGDALRDTVVVNGPLYYVRLPR